MEDFDQTIQDRISRKSSLGEGIAWAGFWLAVSIAYAAGEIAQAL